MLTAEQRERVAAMDLLLAPILRHMPDVQLCDMARLRHPPRTKAVADWAEMADARATEYLQRYRAMTGRDDASAAIGADESCTKIVQEAELAVNETGTVPVDARSNRINSSQIESTKHHRGGHLAGAKVPAPDGVGAAQLELCAVEWNQLAAASEWGFKQIRKLTDARRKKLQDLLSEHGLAGWREGLGKVRDSSFLGGANEREWTANFDFVIDEEHFQRLLEGNYDDRTDQINRLAGAT